MLNTKFHIANKLHWFCKYTLILYCFIDIFTWCYFMLQNYFFCNIHQKTTFFKVNYLTFNLQQEQLCRTSSCEVIAVFENLSFISTTSTTNGVYYTVDTKSTAAKWQGSLLPSKVESSQPWYHWHQELQDAGSREGVGCLGLQLSDAW